MHHALNIQKHLPRRRRARVVVLLLANPPHIVAGEQDQHVLQVELEQVPPQNVDLDHQIVFLQDREMVFRNYSYSSRISHNTEYSSFDGK